MFSHFYSHILEMWQGPSIFEGCPCQTSL